MNSEKSKSVKPETLKPIMFVGTASDVGKSIITAGFCRIFKQDGYLPAPFKAQNMSLNSYATAEGFEIGRAQAVQAEAAGIPCHTDMNPILLKPTSDKSSQVVLNGKPVGDQSAIDYFLGNDKQELGKEAVRAFDRLSARYNPIVLEGAGSISELNLKHRDITNMRMALYAHADTYLVADIDRGGVFASVHGTIALLPPEEKKLIKGIIINKFRGDARLFEKGQLMLEELTGIPVVGVVPHLNDLKIEEEDSVALQWKQSKIREGKVNIAVVLLKRISNYTDFKALENDDRINLFYCKDSEELKKADIIIIPGSKNTIADLTDLKNSGMAAAIIQAYKNNKTVIGICGGYQMLGELVEDPFHVEGDIESMAGLGLLPVHTVIGQSKQTEQCKFYFKNRSEVCEGYEIHMGDTTVRSKAEPVNVLLNGKQDGYKISEKCWGTYIHGILDNQAVIDDIIGEYQQEKRITSFDYKKFKEDQYDLLALHLRKHIDMEHIYRNLRS